MRGHRARARVVRDVFERLLQNTFSVVVVNSSFRCWTLPERDNPKAKVFDFLTLCD